MLLPPSLRPSFVRKATAKRKSLTPIPAGIRIKRRASDLSPRICGPPPQGQVEVDKAVKFSLPFRRRRILIFRGGRASTCRVGELIMQAEEEENDGTAAVALGEKSAPSWEHAASAHVFSGFRYPHRVRRLQFTSLLGGARATIATSLYGQVLRVMLTAHDQPALW